MNSKISDQAVENKTGKNWQDWFEALDKINAHKMDHKNIVIYINEHFSIPSWWAQNITVAYEQARGLREVHEKSTGFEISMSITIKAVAKSLYEAFTEPALRKKWLEEKIDIHTFLPFKSISASFANGNKNLSVHFYEKAKRKILVVVQQSKLADAAEAEACKTFWEEALEMLRNNAK